MRNLLGNYFWWSYERGSFHYDVMVTLILVFLFVSPHLINYRDRPVETVALQSTEVLIREAGQVGSSAQFIVQIRADMSGGPQPSQSDDQRRAAILRVVEPISGAVTVERYEPVLDAHNQVIAYNAWVLR